MVQPAHDDHRPHAKSLRVGRQSEAFACYAVTKCPQGRDPILATPQSADLILSSFDYLRKSDEIRLLAFCIMPDHYHVLMFLVGGESLSDVMKSTGKFTGRRLNQLLGRRGQFWEDGFHDHRCRDEDDIEDRMTYIEHNPVRSGLVEKAEDWPYSSAHRSQRQFLDRDWYAIMR